MKRVDVFFELPLAASSNHDIATPDQRTVSGIP
jgi:hypothetical protein